MRLELTVFLCGAGCMAMEMVGARILAPHVGTSAIVWTSLIGVMLGFMALGAWMGGRLADSRLDSRGFAAILAGAGLGCGLAALAGHSAAGFLMEHVRSLHAAATLCAAAIFALPALFFGMASPYAIRLRLADLDHAGATVGRLYALSTAGSILGTFLGGFVLISWLPGLVILWGLAALLLGLSLLNAAERPHFRLIGLLLCILLGATDMAGASPMRLESPYSSIFVRDDEENGRAGRLMITNPGAAQSGMFLDDPAELRFDYTKYYALGPLLSPGAKSVLMLGGGGYSVPKWILSSRSGLPDDLDLTVVELDPGMTEASRRWFGLKDDPRMRIIHEDARVFLNRNERVFDLVLVDVFTSWYSIPFQMATVEAARELRRATADDGVVLMNVISAASGPDARLLQGIVNAMGGAFEEVRIHCVRSTQRPSAIQNVMVAAFPRRRTEEPTPPNEEIAAMLRSRCRSCEDEARHGMEAFLDDFAPVERAMLPMLRR